MEIKTPYIWKNGEIVAWDNITEHHLTHSLHYGWWVFEWIRFYNTFTWPKIFRLKDHIDRLYYSASVLDLDIPFSKEELINETIRLVEKNWEKTGYIRHIVYSGYGKMGLNPKGAKIEVWISVWKWWKYLSDNAINVKIAKIRRIHPATTDMWAKISWNYANSILVSQEIKKAWFDEWLLLDTDWFIAEWPGENIFFIKWDKLITPSIWTILPGITRSTIMEIAKNEFNMEVIERKIKPEEIKDFEESFFTGTAAEVTVIWSITDEMWNKIEFSSWNQNSKSNELKNFYLDLVNWKAEKYKNRLF